MSMPRKIRCTVETVASHGGRVYTVDLHPESPVPAFHPGQFLHLTVEDYDPAGFWPESRVFSIASPSRERHRLRLCYAVKGRYTARIEAALRPGATVWIKLPYGEFVIDPADAAVLLAGGTGITAFTAFIEALTPDHPHSVWLAYGARCPELLLFRDMILAQLDRVPSFHALFFAEHDAPNPAASPDAALTLPACMPGRITLDSVFHHAPNAAASVFYLSGPPPMLKTFSAGLAARGVPADRIRTDAWE
ncbi:MAG: FAD-dependent oxidoreductase [Verrucomicrobia bacterium]|nr:FAD-dependent oxidoreductase [Verrucomicrobiota bacterium]